jgi:hypothetical protein
MNPVAIAKAKERLTTAKTLIERIENCRTYQEFKSEWYLFLVTTKNIYTTLQIGSKTSAKSSQWYGAKIVFHENDELLQYLYIARNDAEHGLSPGTEYVPGELILGVTGHGLSNAFMLNGSIGTGLRATSLDGLPIGVKETRPHAKLITVTDKGGNKFAPPTSHLGQPITDRSPLAIARLASSYLESLIREAETLS